ncbi:MAG: hypothetical protein LIO80_01885, partial [Lachnospiraceae bacterium]|nr:hypothetical protein [Lachnospiraceae bacterium]
LTITNKRVFGVLSGSLTIEDGEIAYVASGDTTLAITRAGASFSAKDVTFTAASVDEGTTTTSQYLVYAAAGGSVTLTDCAIDNVSNAVVKDNANTATVVLNCCTHDVTAVSGSNAEDDAYTIYFNTGSVLAQDSNGLVKVEDGYTYVVLTGGSVTADSTIYVKDGGKLVLDGGTLTGKVIVRSGGTLEVQSGSVSNDITVESGGILSVSGGTVSGAITNSGTTSISDGTVSGAVTNASGASLTLSDSGTIANTIKTAGTFNMTGGTVSATGLNSDNGAIHVTAGTINISGGAVTAEGDKARAISTANGASIADSNISGGTFMGSNLALLVQTGTTGLSVTGGTFITSESGMASVIDRADAIAVDVYDMSGEVITKDNSNYYSSTVGDYTVFVGSFPYKMTVTTTDGTITGYSSLANAIKAANSLSGSTVKMFANAGYSTSYWTVSGTVTIDLNGHTISSSPTSSSYGTLYVTGSLTLTDSAGGGYVKNNSSSTYGNAVRVYTSASFTMEGGTLTGKYGIYGSQYSTITITGGTVNATGTYAVQTLGGTITITGDDEVTITNTSTSSSARGIYMQTNNGSVLTIDNPYTYISAKTAIGNSSTKTYTASVKAGYYSTDVTNYVADGYACVENDDEETSSTYPYVVTSELTADTAYASVTSTSGTKYYVTLEKAVAAATDGDSVKLLKSMSGNGINLDTADKSITIDLGGNTYTVTSAVGSTGTVSNGLRFLEGGSVTITNGTIVAGVSAIQILIQNYCDLTLDNVTLSSSTASTFYTYGVSCIGGSVTLQNGTIINKPYTSNGYSLRVYYWDSSYPDGVTVTVEDSCVINGDILYTNNGTDADAENVAEKAKLIIRGGEFYGSIITENLNENGDTGIEISGGHFADEVLIDYCADGYVPYTETDGKYPEQGIPYTVAAFTLGISTDSTTTVSATIADGYGTSTLYVKVSGDYIGTDGYYSTSDYPTTDLTFTETDDDGSETTHTYIFAGWYSATDGTSSYYSAMWDSVSSDNDYYAKFVDADMLDVKCVVSTVNSASRWRFVTSIDSLKYDSIGFDLSQDSTTLSTSKVSIYGNSVKVTSLDDPVTILAADICSASKYVATAYYDDSDTESETSFTVNAYIVTNDGTTVKGDTVIFSYSGSVGLQSGGE